MFAAVALSGCTESNDDCIDGVCTETVKPGDSFITNATRDVAEMTGCTGGYVGLEVPEQLVVGHVPDEFQTTALRNGMADLRIFAYECPRVDIGGRIIEPFRVVTTGVAANPKDSSWEPPATPGQYTFEVFTDNETVGRALSAWNLPLRQAKIAVDVEDNPRGAQVTWSVDTGTGSYGWSFLPLQGPGGAWDAPYTMWAGTGPFFRTDLNESSTHSFGSGRSVDLLRMSGDAALRAIIGADAVPLSPQAYVLYDAEWAPYPHPFGSGAS